MLPVELPNAFCDDGHHPQELAAPDGITGSAWYISTTCDINLTRNFKALLINHEQRT